MKKNSPKILLVEDDANLGYVLSDFLQMSNYEVVLARDGKEGFEKFRDGNYDLCILDVMLPLMDGFTLAEEIRKSDPDIPFIFLTAKNMEKDRIRGLKIGADDYITKPFSTEELNLRIDAILRRSKYSILKNDVSSLFHIGSMTFDYTNHILKSPYGRKTAHQKRSRSAPSALHQQEQSGQARSGPEKYLGRRRLFHGEKHGRLHHQTQEIPERRQQCLNR